VSLFKNLFAGNSNSLKQCPRCLGKGEVDWDDIKRLNQELKWKPGPCAYCNGTGKVDKNIEDNVPVDSSYLVMDIPEEQRRRMITGHPDAIEYGKQIDDDIEYFIDQISYLHFEGGLDSSRIAKFFLLGEEAAESYEAEYKELVEYVDRVIAKKASNT
jgi:hypothetical protein